MLQFIEELLIPCPKLKFTCCILNKEQSFLTERYILDLTCKHPETYKALIWKSWGTKILQKCENIEIPIDIL